jgi:protein TonB
LRYKINSHKIYPRSAKKRGIVGSVYIKFTINRDGTVSNIRLKGKSIFYRASKSAVLKSFPISKKEYGRLLPMSVTLTLKYNINHR